VSAGAVLIFVDKSLDSRTERQQMNVGRFVENSVKVRTTLEPKGLSSATSASLPYQQTSGNFPVTN
jgi:hypothetical protein